MIDTTEFYSPPISARYAWQKAKKRGFCSAMMLWVRVSLSRRAVETAIKTIDEEFKKASELENFQHKEETRAVLSEVLSILESARSLLDQTKNQD